MSVAEYSILFLAVLVGGSIALYMQQFQRKYLNWVLAFSGAYLLGIAVLHLMPIAFHGDTPSIGLWILAGFFVQLLLEQLSGGVEHGHIHPHQHSSGGFVIQVMLGLCLHAFFEGLPLGNYEALQHAHHGHVHAHDHLLWGIILHKAPAAFALTILLLSSGFKRMTALFCLVIFAAMSPLGAGLAHWLGQQQLLDQQIQEKIIAFVIGSFLHIATTILFETDGSAHHRLPRTKIFCIALGLGLAVLSM